MPCVPTKCILICIIFFAYRVASCLHCYCEALLFSIMFKVQDTWFNPNFKAHRRLNTREVCTPRAADIGDSPCHGHFAFQFGYLKGWIVEVTG